MDTYIYYKDIDEIIVFLYFLKCDLFTANSEDTNFIFHM